MMSKNVQQFFAPGRVNLIGEHLDYNGGLVLPAALSIGIKATYRKRNDSHVLLTSSAHSLIKEIHLQDAYHFQVENGWANYPIGIIEHLKKEGRQLSGCEIHYESNLPEGSGLSSSAAIEVLTAYTLLSQTESDMDLVWLANFCREVENEYIGVQCGIMDQYAVALGKRDSALLLDCHTLEHRYIAIELEDYKLMLMNTNKPRSLIHSKYNERKRECEEALRIIRATQSGVSNLCEASPYYLDLLQNETIRKRAKHVITENLRVKESVKALRLNDLSTFGRLMNASHQSLKEDYEVTGIELDTLAETAQQTKGCLGARMTGAGFGGCAIAIVHQAMIEEFKNKVGEKYLAVTGMNCDIFESEIGDGVRKTDGLSPI